MRGEFDIKDVGREWLEYISVDGYSAGSSAQTEQLRARVDANKQSKCLANYTSLIIVASCGTYCGDTLNTFDCVAGHLVSQEFGYFRKTKNKDRT